MNNLKYILIFFVFYLVGKIKIIRCREFKKICLNLECSLKYNTYFDIELFFELKVLREIIYQKIMIIWKYSLNKKIWFFFKHTYCLYNTVYNYGNNWLSRKKFFETKLINSYLRLIMSQKSKEIEWINYIINWKEIIKITTNDFVSDILRKVDFK